MLQLIRHITKNPCDKTRMSLIFANQVSSAESALSLQRENGMFAELGLCIHSSPLTKRVLLGCLWLWEGLVGSWRS